MIKHLFFKSAFFCLFCLLLSFPVYAEAPALLNYEGTLADTSGNPVPDGQYEIEFSIYDVATGGTPLWSEKWTFSTSPVVVTNGRFNVLLGSHAPIPENFFEDRPVTYLGIKVGTDAEMLPRQRLASVPYAITAGSGGIPKGAIIMWSGSVIPKGWVLCDGNNGTPDLKGKFIVGAWPGHADYSLGTQKGEEKHTLTINEMPSHNHTTTIQRSNDDSSKSNAFREGEPTLSPSFPSSYTGGNAPHENRPPYYALCFIMKQ